MRSPGKPGAGKDDEPLTAAELEDPRGEPVWDVGGESDEEDGHPKHAPKPSGSGSGLVSAGASGAPLDDVRSPFISAEEAHEDEDDAQRQKGKAADPFRDPHRTATGVDDDEFGDWEDGSKVPADSTTHR